MRVLKANPEVTFLQELSAKTIAAMCAHAPQKFSLFLQDFMHALFLH
jgi:hypothetical protein